jgi:hypothetical protein
MSSREGSRGTARRTETNRGNSRIGEKSRKGASRSSDYYGKPEDLSQPFEERGADLENPFEDEDDYAPESMEHDEDGPGADRLFSPLRTLRPPCLALFGDRIVRIRESGGERILEMELFRRSLQILLEGLPDIHPAFREVSPEARMWSLQGTLLSANLDSLLDDLPSSGSRRGQSPRNGNKGATEPVGTPVERQAPPSSQKRGMSSQWIRRLERGPLLLPSGKLLPLSLLIKEQGRSGLSVSRSFILPPLRWELTRRDVLPSSFALSLVRDWIGGRERGEDCFLNRIMKNWDELLHRAFPGIPIVSDPETLFPAEPTLQRWCSEWHRALDPAAPSRGRGRPTRCAGKPSREGITYES